MEPPAAAHGAANSRVVIARALSETTMRARARREILCAGVDMFVPNGQWQTRGCAMARPGPHSDLNSPPPPCRPAPATARLTGPCRCTREHNAYLTHVQQAGCGSGPTTDVR
eukprot:5294337-Prymnesium_polylepis.1